jgi:hypothetical protein
MESRDTERLVTGFIDSDKGHSAGVIEVRQSGDELRRKFLDGIEEAEPQILLTCTSRSRISRSSSGLTGRTNIRSRPREGYVAPIATDMGRCGLPIQIPRPAIILRFKPFGRNVA